ncbi:PilX N-terminal domain-containing pilus assembly protein [Marinobacter sp. 71-i]|uniref:PilX N-terminal domain-containing pilus assembly protein n=1 Tax=Marinobacter iranensis TaxID=2962607 RepID=A0ABT5YBW2_9GAMM|nr:PilX N-terminal domain-containing pilus assembly protein [Marinobacter iranensis]MDF0751173.1 PilX N-terminal domain-containing pilus assembly protein [Marinobacter iranensis]
MKTTRAPVTPVAVTPFNQRQRGATLIVALVMLLLISLLAIGGMQGSVMQERMASNAHDSAISFQASEAALRQAEDDIMNTLSTRQAAFNEDLLDTPWEWDGNNPASSGTGVAGPDVSAQPVYHLARLADVCPIEPGQPCFERYLTTSRAQGGSAEAVTVLQSTVLLPPE